MGLDKQIHKIEFILDCKTTPARFIEKNYLPNGIIIHGAHGTGKTSIANAILKKYGSGTVIKVSPLNLIKDVIDDAKNSIIIIDDFDKLKAMTLLQADTESDKQSKSRYIIATLIEKLLEKEKNNIVVAITTDKNSIDPSLKRLGMFEEEIEIPLPSKDVKKELLAAHVKKLNLSKEVDFEELANAMPGYSCEDVILAVKKAVGNAVKRQSGGEKNMFEMANDRIIVRDEDFKQALKMIKPMGMRNSVKKIPDVKWEDIGGLENIVQEIKKDILRLRHPEILKKRNLRPVRGILLSGPPGTGKTLLAKAIANEAGFNFVSFNAPDVFNKYLGKSDENVRNMFSTAAQSSPAVLFIDEFDAISGTRKDERSSDAYNTVVNTLLSQMDGIEELDNVIVIAATNRLDAIDPAVRRSGRFDKNFEVDLPGENVRAKIFRIFFNKHKLPIDDALIGELCGKTEKFSGADIENACRRIAEELADNEINDAEGLQKQENLEISLNEKFDRVIKNIIGSDKKKERIGFVAERLRKDSG
ncbi:MAG: AAA family ATPase [Candidatus Marsarchaeota archaeon]|nr:AAA family ATPase [Candidatus Marsarchaeota archaeon]